MAFTYKLELNDGTPADPRTLRPPRRPGDLATRSRSGATESFRVIDTRLDEG
jgi:hypothetical protein